MADTAFIMDLAKLMIAVAWADGELSNDEVNALKDLTFMIPELTQEAWMELEIYMDSQVSDAEAERLLANVINGMKSSDDQMLVIDTLRNLVAADGEVTAEEKTLLGAIEADVNDRGTGLFADLARFMKDVIQRRLSAGAAGPNRESRLDDYIRNAVYFDLVTHMENTGAKIDLSEAAIRKVCIAGALMAAAAWADMGISDTETGVIAGIIATDWHVPDAEAQLIAEVSCNRITRNLDQIRLCRQFCECTTFDERKDFLRCLFHIANACGKTQHNEIEDLNTIARALKLSHKDFINAKLTIPHEDRGGL